MNTRNSASSTPLPVLYHHHLPNCLAMNLLTTGMEPYLFPVVKTYHFFFSKEETMYLEVTLPAIRSSLMVISDHGRDTIDFGDIVNGNVHFYLMGLP